MMRALGVAAGALPLTLASFAGCAGAAWSLGAGAVLFAVLFALSYAGGVAGRAALPGLVAGAATLAIPLIASRTLEGLPAALAACVLAGVGSGAVLLANARRLASARPTFMLVAGTVAALVGSLGCLGVGFGGLAAMVLGLAATAPVLGLVGVTR
jgi:hypothetical protein